MNPARDVEFNHIQGVGERREGKGHSAVRIFISLRKTRACKGRSPGFHDLCGPSRKPRVAVQLSTHGMLGNWFGERCRPSGSGGSSVVSHKLPDAVHATSGGSRRKGALMNVTQAHPTLTVCWPLHTAHSLAEHQPVPTAPLPALRSMAARRFGPRPVQCPFRRSTGTYCRNCSTLAHGFPGENRVMITCINVVPA